MCFCTFRSSQLGIAIPTGHFIVCFWTFRSSQLGIEISIGLFTNWCKKQTFWMWLLGVINYVDHCTVVDVIHWRLISPHKEYDYGTTSGYDLLWVRFMKIVASTTEGAWWATDGGGGGGWKGRKGNRKKGKRETGKNEEREKWRGIGRGRVTPFGGIRTYNANLSADGAWQASTRGRPTPFSLYNFNSPNGVRFPMVTS